MLAQRKPAMSLFASTKQTKNHHGSAQLRPDQRSGGFNRYNFALDNDSSAK
jgi:hypothetical protein